MQQWITTFLADDSGQDIIEYSLLMTFIVIACMWLLGAGEPAVNRIWTKANNHITEADNWANGRK